MARYIDADKLCEALKSMADVQYPEKQNTILGVVSSIENFRTADVVPRAVAEEQSILWRDHFNSIYESAKAALKATVARDIFLDIAREMAKLSPPHTVHLIGGRIVGKTLEIGREKGIREVLELLSELEKKYMDELK